MERERQAAANEHEEITGDYNSEIDNEEASIENGDEEDENEDENEEDVFVFPSEDKRPYAVMIDNEGTKCLPQGGLDKAQVIYEIIVEGGETRFMLLFWGTRPEMIGPVRSTRHYFLDYVLEHDAIHVHFGWSPRAISDISSLRINNINGVANGGEIFWDLTNDINNWQDSYTSMEKIEEYVNRVKYRTTNEKEPVFAYNMEDEELESEINAERVGIYYNQFNTSEYVYDPLTGWYNRFRKGKPHVERVSEAQLTVKNIIVQFAKNYPIPGDPEGRQEVETVGSGEGWFITRGKAIKIKWSKASRSEPTRYVDKAGNPIRLNPGQTWVQVISPYAKVEIQ
ncbi:MAG: DUF3048 domain-containing protein [Clostridiaceae bacterium]|nr:DUF3048 domain-containing protein [Clostridiaceae bacterium]